MHSDHWSYNIKATSSSNLPEKVRDRLEQLDEIEDGPNLSNLTQAEYTKTIEEMGKVRKSENLSILWFIDVHIYALLILVHEFVSHQLNGKL